MTTLHRYKYLFLTIGTIACLLWSEESLAQETTVIDSLKLALNSNDASQKMTAMIDLSWEYQYIDFDSAIYYGQEALNVANLLDDINGKAGAYSALGNVYFNAGKFILAEDYYRKVLAIDEELGDELYLAKDHTNIANVLQRKGDYKEAVAYYFDALNSFEKLKDSASMIVVYINIGNNFGYREEFERSRFYYKKALKTSKHIKDDLAIARAYNMLGVSETKLKNYNVANTYYNQASRTFDSLEFLPGQSGVLVNKALMYLDMEDYQKAIEYYKAGLEIDEKIDDFEGQMVAKVNLASCYLNMDDLETANQYLQSVVEMASKAKSKRLLVQAYLGLYELHKKNHDFQKALEFHEMYAQWHDSLVKEGQIHAIEELEIKYRVGNQEQEINILREQKMTSEAIASRKNILLISSIALSLLIVIGAFLFIRYRSSKSRQKQVVLEQKALRAQMNPHFIFNSLNSIQRLYVEGKTDLANDYTADFAELIRRILDNSDRSLITLREELETLRLYVELEKIRCKEILEYKVELSDGLPLDQVMVPPLIIQPFVENAIWHGILPKKMKGEIIVKIENENGKYASVSIVDTGIGWHHSEKFMEHDSKGIKITEQRIGSKITINSPSHGGTTVSFKIPLA